MIDSPSHQCQPLTDNAELRFQLRHRITPQLTTGKDPQAVQFTRGLAPDATDFADRQLLEQVGNRFRRNQGQAIRLMHLGGQLGEQFIGSDTDGTGQTEMDFDA